MNIIDALVTDRTSADVARLIYLNGLWDPVEGWTGTAEELGEWWNGEAVPLLAADGEILDANGELLYCREGTQRGAYNASDLNRVEETVDYLAGLLRNCGNTVEVYPKKGWTTEDVPANSDMKRYLDDVAALRTVLAVLPTTPEVPAGMEGLTYREANAIEQILADIDLLIKNVTAAWFYSGDLYAGEV